MCSTNYLFMNYDAKIYNIFKLANTFHIFFSIVICFSAKGTDFLRGIQIFEMLKKTLRKFYFYLFFGYGSIF